VITLLLENLALGLFLHVLVLLIGVLGITLVGLLPHVLVIVFLLTAAPGPFLFPLFEPLLPFFFPLLLFLLVFFEGFFTKAHLNFVLGFISGLEFLVLHFLSDFPLDLFVNETQNSLALSHLLEFDVIVFTLVFLLSEILQILPRLNLRPVLDNNLDPSTVVSGLPVAIRVPSFAALAIAFAVAVTIPAVTLAVTFPVVAIVFAIAPAVSLAIAVRRSVVAPVVTPTSSSPGPGATAVPSVTVVTPPLAESFGQGPRALDAHFPAAECFLVESLHLVLLVSLLVELDHAYH